MPSIGHFLLLQVLSKEKTGDGGGGGGGDGGGGKMRRPRAFPISMFTANRVPRAALLK